MTTLTSSCIVSLSFYNIKEFSVSLFTKTALLILVQAIFISRGFSVILNINTHLCHFLLLYIYKFALFFPLQMPKYVYFLCSCHSFNVINCDLRRSKRHIGYLWVKSAKAKLLAYPPWCIDEALLLLSCSHCKLLLIYLHLIHLSWMRIENTWDLLASNIVLRRGLSGG